jgi:hypothetical protein
VSHASFKAPTDIEIPSNSLWAKLPLLGGAAAVLGLGATLVTALGHAHRARAMFSYLWAFEVFLTIALGAFVWVMVEHLSRSAWSVVVRRVGETAMATLPIFALLFIPIVTLGYHELYPWTHESDEILERKRWFLTTGFFLGRAAFYLIVWAVLSRMLYSLSTKQDLVNDVAARDALTRRMWKVSAAGILLYGLTQSFAAIDWVMSLQPHWYSTIFGVYFYAASILAFYAFISLVTMGLQKAGVLREAVTQEHYHDFGKYIFGYTIFWTYIAFSQFLLIWYANIPEETEFYLVRLHGGWEWVSYALPLLHFAVPFFWMMSRQIKRRRTYLALGSVWILLMHLLDMYWLILPNFGVHGEGHAEPHFGISWLDFAALIGMGGAFMAAFGWMLTKNKVVAVQDPRLPESLAHENY